MQIFRSLLQEVEVLNRRHNLFERGDRIVLGLSGGADSLFLLETLKALTHKYSLGITAAHLDHGIQHKQNSKHLLFCKEYCRRIGVSFFSARVSVPAVARRLKLSLEEAGRNERYQFFRDVAQKTRSNKIATAHTLDDQAETVLLRLLRGTGLRGLGGIPVKRVEGGAYEVIRPLASCEKKDILRYFDKTKEKYCIDSSNHSNDYLRNRVRNSLLPELQKNYNPKIKTALCQLAEISLNAHKHLEMEASRILSKQKVLLGGKGRIRLEVKNFCLQARSIQSEIVAQVYTSLKGDLRQLAYSHIDSTILAAQSVESGLEIHLPHGITMKKSRGLLVFSRAL